MSDAEYLKRVLEGQTLSGDSKEIKELHEHRDEVEQVLRDEFGSSPVIRYGGAVAKGTLIRESYDLDMTCYFPADDDTGGETLKDIYESVDRALRRKYSTERKASAIRVHCNDIDYHIDVVPGRFVSGKQGDVFLYRASGEKERLKTNLDKHIAHVKGSGVLDSIRLMKLWKARRRLSVKTFALELLTIAELDNGKSWSLPEQLIHVWTRFRDHSDELSVEDPANPQGNDLSELLTAAIRQELRDHARTTLGLIENSGWRAVFGDVGESDAASTAALRRVASVSSVPSRPWRSA